MAVDDPDRTRADGHGARGLGFRLFYPVLHYVTDLPDVPATLDILNARQGVDDVAALAGTIGYEILTSLGHRYTRQWS